MVYQILNGDNLATQLKETALAGDTIIFREALMEGPVQGSVLEEFLKGRSDYFSAGYSVSYEMYMRNSVAEIGKILSIPDDAEVNLWFGNDLFCQVNMWFILSLSGDFEKRIYYRIFPPDSDGFGTCNGFAITGQSLLNDMCQSRVKFKMQDLRIATDLWRAFQGDGFSKLREIAKGESSGFRYLKEVVEAHIDRFEANGKPGRLELVLSELSKKHSGDFNLIFAEFTKREPIYGFSDLQVKAMLTRIPT